MPFQSGIAQALIDTLKTCVDCTRYDRVLWQLGDPTIECSTLAVSLLTFPPVAQVADCAVHELRMSITVAQCCYPTGGPNGEPPATDAIEAAAKCVADDVERILCCLQGLAFDIPGAVKPCRPKVLAPTYSRPLGGCLVAKIGLNLTGVPNGVS